MSKRRQLHELPAHTCQGGARRCVVCLGAIETGQHYYGGSSPRRAHQTCAHDVAAGRKRELTRQELVELDDAELAVSTARGQLYRIGLDDRGGFETRAAATMAAGAERRLEETRARLLP